jgi:thiamine pyrophosphate-dependent acetolactate synthase large subunit-like protein
MKVVEALAAALAEEGVEHVFCLTGDGNLELLVELADSYGVELVHARHEQGAVAMADGYWRRSGRLGVCSVTHGPGVTQTATSLKVAVERGSGVLLIAGGTPTEDPRHVQYFDQAAFARSLGAATVTLRSPRRWAADLAEALESAAAGIPTVLIVPTDYLASPIEDATREPVLPVRPPLAAAASGLEEAVAALRAAERPVLLAGRGAWAAERELGEISIATGAPVLTTLGAKGLLADDPRLFGMIGSLGDPAALSALDAADCVLAAGASLNPWSTKNGRLLGDAKVLQVDSSPTAFGRYHDPDICLLGDAAATLGRLAGLLVDAPDGPPQGAASLPAPVVEEGDPEYEDGDGTVDPRRLVAALQDVLPADRTLVFDGGHFITFACGGLGVSSPDRYIFTCDFATVGQGLGNAIGAAVAEPGSRTTVIAGDGGFLMSIAELDTAVRYDLPLDVVIFDDEAYGQEAHSLAAKGRSPRHATFETPDLVGIAQGYGAEGHLITSAEELERLPNLLSGVAGPRLIVVKVNRAVVSPAAQEIFRQVREVVPG